jgi:ABC-2 type transport system permease protein
MFFLTFSIVSLAMGFGAVYPRFKHENIAQVSMGFGGLSYMITSAVLTAVVILIEAWPVYVIFMAQKKGFAISTGQWIFIVTSFATALAILTVAVFKPMKTGFEALERYEG